MLEMERLSVGYRRRGKPVPILQGIEARAEAGELICLLGANGAGKSTLLRTLMGFQSPLAGRVLIEGQSLAGMSRREVARYVSAVVTERVAVGQLRAYDLVAIGRYPYTDWAGRLGPEDHEAVREAIDAAGATTLALRRVNELSDGERQRVMIARALAQNPRLLLLDEPTAFLDVRGRVSLVSMLKRLARESRLTVIMATHEIEHVLRQADTLWMIDPERKLVVGAPEDLGLAGELDRTIAGDTPITLDPVSGTFRTSAAATGTAAVIGEGTQRAWTERALERAGYRITSSHILAESDVKVRCDCEEGVCRWVVSRSGREERVDSLDRLVRTLQERPDSDSMAVATVVPGDRQSEVATVPAKRMSQ